MLKNQLLVGILIPHVPAIKLLMMRMLCFIQMRMPGINGI
jgi:hypothetical protein